MIGDLTLDAIHAGLRGLDARRKVAEDAIANAETPGYRARQVDFEAALNEAIESGDPIDVSPQVSFTSDPVDLPTGNNVQMDRELVGLSETALRQQLLVEAANAKFRLLRTVITGA